MPFITIDMWKGHTKEKRQKLIEKVTDAVVDSIGCPKDTVQVVLNEVPQENWGIAGKPCTGRPF